MGSNSDCCVGMGKFLAFLSFVAFLVIAAAMANPYWLKKEFSMPGGVSVESKIGILWACTDTSLPAPLDDDYECQSLGDIDADLVADWQWIAAGLGCGSLVLTFISLLLSGCIGCKAGRSMNLRAVVIICYLIACGLFVAVLVLFKENKEVTVFSSPLLTLKQEFNFDWGFYVAAVGAGVLFVMAFLHGCVACGSNNAVSGVV